MTESANAAESRKRQLATDDELGDAYWAQLLDEAYRLQIEHSDDEDVDEEIEP